MTTTTNALATLDGPPSAHDPVLWRFVARVQALTPAEWGRLDALAAPIAARTPVAASRRLRLCTAMFGGWWREPARDMGRAILDDPSRTLPLALALSAGVALELLRPSTWKDLGNPKRPVVPPDLPAEAKAKLEAELAEIDARAEDHQRATRLMWDAAKAQPLGPGAAYWALTFAELAIYSRDSLTPELLARLYAYMEPVIPYASLTSA
jgi:hypothetical protein